MIVSEALKWRVGEFGRREGLWVTSGVILCFTSAIEVKTGSMNAYIIRNHASFYKSNLVEGERLELDNEFSELTHPSAELMGWASGFTALCFFAEVLFIAPPVFSTVPVTGLI